MALKLLIKRYDHGKKQTLGNLVVLDENNCEKFHCHTLELPWKENKFQVSCIPVGTYKVVRRHSAKFGHHFHITDVEGRTFILIHSGNYYTDILGCVLVGMGLTDINGDGLKDVTQSKNAMSELLKMMSMEFELKIENI